ncbi:hypothetical protein E4T47_03542 [Aureobasidium subglaciale]|nr:hypothetical protein E4T47_03542 [Aureobasidium subglaciale]
MKLLRSGTPHSDGSVYLEDLWSTPGYDFQRDGIMYTMSSLFSKIRLGRSESIQTSYSRFTPPDENRVSAEISTRLYRHSSLHHVVMGPRPNREDLFHRPDSHSPRALAQYYSRLRGQVRRTATAMLLEFRKSLLIIKSVSWPYHGTIFHDSLSSNARGSRVKKIQSESDSSSFILHAHSLEHNVLDTPEGPLHSQYTWQKDTLISRTNSTITTSPRTDRSTLLLLSSAAFFPTPRRCPLLHTTTLQLHFIINVTDTIFHQYNPTTDLLTCASSLAGGDPFTEPNSNHSNKHFSFSPDPSVSEIVRKFIWGSKFGQPVSVTLEKEQEYLGFIYIGELYDDHIENMSDRLITQSNSRLTKANLVTLLTKEEAWSSLDLETRRELYRMLPSTLKGDMVAIDPDVHPLKTGFAKYIKHFIYEWEQDLAAGRRTAKWQREAKQASGERIAGVYDGWKETEREEHWGQKYDREHYNSKTL